MTQSGLAKYDQLIVYYFSGTGNAKNAATWIKDLADERGIPYALINIDRFDKIEIPKTTGKLLIGFCAPTHGFNLPPLMLKFILKFPKIKNADAFILNTRGGLKLSKLFIPGLSGLAQIFPTLILLLKRFKVVGMQPLDLPSNWIILHPGLKQEVIKSIYSRCNTKVEQFANSLLNGKSKYKALISLPIDLLIAPIAVGYYFIGRFFLAKTLVASDDCNQCGICIKQCPVSAIKMVKETPFWTYKCESCMRCINNCPQRAIETAHGFVALILYVAYGLAIPAIFLMLKKYQISEPNEPSVFLGYLWSIFEWLIFIIIVFIGYRILYYFMQFKSLNRIVTYSSLSKYKFWRRYHSPKTANN